jgi:hypothetical protein
LSDPFTTFFFIIKTTRFISIFNFYSWLLLFRCLHLLFLLPMLLFSVFSFTSFSCLSVLTDVIPSIIFDYFRWLRIIFIICRCIIVLIIIHFLILRLEILWTELSKRLRFIFNSINITFLNGETDSKSNHKFINF